MRPARLPAGNRTRELAPAWGSPGGSATPGCGSFKRMLRIYITSVFVDDQERALRFYTDVLGFEKKNDVPVGEFRWLTVTAPV